MNKQDGATKKPDLHGNLGRGWIGVDLDGTLAEYHRWEGYDIIGDPIPRMVARVVEWLQEGKEVRIVTARVSPVSKEAETAREAIRIWLRKHVSSTHALPITHEKDSHMIELWDDRCVQVIPNTGLRVDGLD